MKKLINHVDSVLAESLDGFAAAHAELVMLGADYQFVRRRALKPHPAVLWNSLELGKMRQEEQSYHLRLRLLL